VDKTALGLDFGTESARALLVDATSGEALASAVEPYPHGVIDEALPSGVRLEADWALQDPRDWLTVLAALVPAVLRQGGVAPESVAGIGLDFTSCTLLPTVADGTPLCALEPYRNQPHAWVKLWKHHAAQPQADRVNALAANRNEPWLPRYGGVISAEWVLPKALELLEQAPELYRAADRLVEGADWVAWQLAGSLTRNACTISYKAAWHEIEGFPSSDYLKALNPGLADLFAEKLAGPVVAPGSRVGGLTAAWAEKLGLKTGTPVAAPLIDAHAAVLGAGITDPGTLLMIMGTSTCHMLMAGREVAVEGISGVARGGILPGLYGYEAGQAGVGDIFAWFTRQAVPPAYHEEARRRGLSLHELLSDKAAALRPGASGLLALDWWNGCRSTLVDANLSGLLVGVTLATRAEEIYRTLLEATAFGAKVILEAFSSRGVAIEAVRAAGGLTKNSLVMQIYADVLGQEVAISGSEQASALGAAMLAAVAGGVYPVLAEAVTRLAPPPARMYQPIPEHRQPYQMLFAEYQRLYDTFGRRNDVMKVLRRLRQTEGD
jgi:L-ribulokinase